MKCWIEQRVKKHEDAPWYFYTLILLLILRWYTLNTLILLNPNQYTYIWHLWLIIEHDVFVINVSKNYIFFDNWYISFRNIDAFYFSMFPHNNLSDFMIRCISKVMFPLYNLSIKFLSLYKILVSSPIYQYVNYIVQAHCCHNDIYISCKQYLKHHHPSSHLVESSKW